MGTIHVTGVTAAGRHGVLPHEKDVPQPFVVDLALSLDLRPAGRSDDLADTVSYAAVAEGVVADVEGPSLDLVEALAWRIGSRVLTEHPRVVEVRVTVTKPRAPIPPHHGRVGVTLTLTREDLS